MNNIRAVLHVEERTASASLAVSATDAAAMSAEYGLRGPKGDKGDKGDTGSPGSPGSPGPQGEPGETPEFSIGNVSTLQPGQSATVTITGTETQPVLNFGIPQGLAGENGAPGQNGQPGATPQISIGTVSTLQPGESATATISGTAAAPVLNFGIPQGAAGQDGAPGQDGQPGATPQISIGTVSTLQPGESATATISGTAAAPVLNFGIPQGAAGQDGQDGATPVRGVDYWTAADQQTVIDAAVAAVLAVYPAAEGVQF